MGFGGRPAGGKGDSALALLVRNRGTGEDVLVSAQPRGQGDNGEILF